MRPPRIPSLAAIAALAGLFAARASASDAEAVEFSVLSYNTHGLPAWIARDDPVSRFPQIGRLANDYDVALIQEDFAHHERLLDGVRHPLVARGNGPRAACLGWLWLLCGRSGSGLTILAHVGAEDRLRLERQAYDHCAGWLGGANDCLASKGLLYARLALADGIAIDFYDTHLDAGDRTADRRARAAQLETLASAIEARSDAAAAIVAGDFNLAADEPADAALLRAFVERLALLDSGARFEDPERWRRQIDYVFYRSGGGVRLVAVAAGEAGEFVEGDRPLSDHPAIFARFRAQRGDPG